MLKTARSAEFRTPEGREKAYQQLKKAEIDAVVVIGGMGSILGSIVTGLSLGVIEGLTKVFYPEASAVVIFLIMVLVLLVKPAGLFGKQA